MSELSRERLSTVDDGFAPDIFLHTVGRGHQGATNFAPTGRAGNRHLHPELVPELNGVFERVLPFWRHVRETSIHYFRSVEGRIEILETGNADAVHPFEIELDAFFGDVAVHPVPPDTWPRGLGGILKAALQVNCALLPNCRDAEEHEQQAHENTGDSFHLAILGNDFEPANPRASL